MRREEKEWEMKQLPERRRAIEVDIAEERRRIQSYRRNVAEEVAKRKAYIDALQNELARPDEALRMPGEIYKAIFGHYPR